MIKDVYHNNVGIKTILYVPQCCSFCILLIVTEIFILNKISMYFLDKLLNSHTIQLATAFLLNHAQVSFLGSSDTATALSKVRTLYATACHHY